MKRKLAICLLALSVALYLTPAVWRNTGAASSNIKIGDYVRFGKYYDESILWRVINIDNDGDPLLFSEHVLCLKAFDSAGGYHPDQGDNIDNRRLHGSGYWKDSNLRQWLNSSEQQVKWLQNIPADENISDGHNPYDKEEGFLSGKNFAQAESNVIKPSTHKAILSDYDKDKSGGGKEVYVFNQWMDEVIQNYEDAFFEYVTDKVFLLSSKEIKEYVFDRGWSLFAFPTSNAVSKSTYRSNPYAAWQFQTGRNWRYWLRSPIGNKSSRIYATGISTSVLMNDRAFTGTGGVRPAMYLRMSSVNVESGTGIKDNPYILKTGLTVTSEEGNSFGKASIPSSWAAADIEAAKGFGLTTARVLSDYQSPVTREEFCELAVRLYEVLSGQQAVSAPSDTFSDTKNAEILKAYNLGIVSGVGGGQFAPTQKVTREQIAVMFYRTMKIAKPDMQQSTAPAPLFKDAGQVESWASEAVKDMSARGIITGTGAGLFSPKGSATKEQAIVLTKRVFGQLN